MESEINKYMNSINNNFLYTFFENEIITNLAPQNITSKPVHWYKCDTTMELNPKNIVSLNDSTIYLVIDSTFYHHFWHANVEIVLALQTYLNYFKNTKLLNKYIFKIIAKSTVIFSSNVGIFWKHITDALKDNLYLVDDNLSSYKGHFLYMKAYNSLPLRQINLSLYDNIIIDANQKYTGCRNYYRKLWVSRRNFNIATYWHKRFNTSLDDVSETILNHGLHEIYFPTDDILYQIYLVSNADVIFSEVGTSMINIFYMKKGSVFITEYDPKTMSYNAEIQRIAKLRGIHILVYNKTCTDDANCELYKLNNGKNINFPYKFVDTDDFKLWFNNNLYKIHNALWNKLDADEPFKPKTIIETVIPETNLATSGKLLVDQTINTKYNIVDELDTLYLLKIHELISLIKCNKHKKYFKIIDEIKTEINNDIVCNTQFICHRVNTISELQNINNEFGVEIDLRDDHNTYNLILSHDPFKAGELFEDYLKNYKHNTLILNIKSERIELAILPLLDKYNITNYFFLDSSFPMIHLLNKNYNNSKIACRFSEYENINNLLDNINLFEYVWVDCFTKLPLNEQNYQMLRTKSIKICIVSPELQQQPEKIVEYRNFVIRNNLIPDMICCKIYNIINWI